MTGMKAVWNTLSEPDMRLIRPWSAELQQSMPFAPPYVSRHTAGEKQLIYVAARHVHKDDTGNRLLSPTFRTISAVFDQHTPQLAIIEGIENTGTASPAFFARKASGDAANNFKTAGENSYTAWRALQAGIPFVSGEPPDKTEVEAAQKRGYSQRDILFWNTFSSLQSGLIDGMITPTPAAIEDSTQRMLAGWSRRMKCDNPTPAEFTGWFNEKTGMPATVENIIAMDTSPSTGPNANYMQRIMGGQDDLREKSVIEAAHAAFTQVDRVIVVYGSAHQPKQEQVFTAQFGKPPLHLKLF